MAEITLEDIVLTLIQGDAALQWSQQRQGWEANSNSNVCSWDGVNCDPIDFSVTEIDVSTAQIQGTIPSSLGILTSLRKLDLSHNDFTGTVPTEVLSLPQLAYVDLGSNRIVGPFPFFVSSNLEVFEIEENQFSGLLPDKIASAYPGLLALNLSNNTLTGTLPEDLCLLTNLNKLNLAFNKFHGVIPHDIGAITHLQGLFLNDNSLYGPIPSSFDNKDNSLVQLFLQHNQLSGTIPGFLSEIHSLKDFFVDGNKLTGAVPTELCDRQLNAVYFEKVPGADARKGCESVSCALNYKSEDGIFPCEKCPESKFTPYLGWNGQCIKVQERHILDTLYQENGGSEWIHAERWGNPNVPHCMYEGIDCNEDGKVVNITLSDMNLKGKIPAKLGRLAHLRNLRLDNNQLTGVVPSDLRFPPLDTLDIANNELGGPVPPLLCQKAGINGNGEKGVFSCDVISCPTGTWYWNGRSKSSGRHCLSCPETPFLGQVRCDSVRINAMEEVGDYVSTHSWSQTALIFLACSLAAVAMFTFIGKRRGVVQNDESSARLANEAFFNEDGVYDVNGEYDQDQEELTVMSYPAGDPSGEVSHDASVQPSEAAARSRDASHDDDPDTQDLWLDVPKIT
eukprot:CAMPEP_0119010232 /NCGR_PEP_ID=MMETSP1176-20130426/4878_1 /TAXON_ID=265551 /ORGANISM="Synedropsis recta cf, Strain CCMP1620" /LENGTH=620 /DNA_ID=CAMNT_0006962859 /DNA_START=77 /DNA_END=1939 /DNA_ORIENTATION=+